MISATLRKPQFGAYFAEKEKEERRQTMVIDPPKVNKNGIYNVSQTAELLGCDRKTVYRYTSSGDLKSFRRACTGGRRSYSGSEILRFWGAQYSG